MDNKKNKYTLDKDGSLFKNGEPTVCPKAPIVYEPNRFNPEKVIMKRIPCTAQCPFMQKAVNNDKKGAGLFCMDKRIFIEIENFDEIIEG